MASACTLGLRRPPRPWEGVAAARRLKGPDVDMWRRSAACFPRVRWVPAHQDAPGGGVSEADWRCIRVADVSARVAVALARVPVAAQERRASSLIHSWVVHDVVAQMETAALAAVHG